MSKEPLIFTITAIAYKPTYYYPRGAPPVEIKIREVVAPPEVIALGRRWESIKSHMEQLKLETSKEVNKWLMENNRTYYDWLRESLATRE